MKKFINKVENVEAEMISGLLKANPKYLNKVLYLYIRKLINGNAPISNYCY